MFLHRSSLAAISLGPALVSGCTTPSEGSPRPATPEPNSPDSTGSTSSDNSGGLPYAGAPHVDDPLDTSRFARSPCETLTAEQTEPLNLPGTGEPMDNVALGDGCEWKNPDTRGYAQIVFADGGQDGLSSEYQANEEGEWEYFDELPDIEGYPAVTRAGTDSHDVGHCVVVVGVADDMVFESIGHLPRAGIGQNDPCEMAALVADLAVKTTKAGT